jgi:phage FluMu protein Com
MDSVELIASGYEWECPKCKVLNTEIEVTEKVKCSSCKVEFEVEDYYHAIG